MLCFRCLYNWISCRFFRLIYLSMHGCSFRLSVCLIIIIWSKSSLHKLVVLLQNLRFNTHGCCCPSSLYSKISPPKGVTLNDRPKRCSSLRNIVASIVKSVDAHTWCILSVSIYSSTQDCCPAIGCCWPIHQLEHTPPTTTPQTWFRNPATSRHIQAI